MANVELTATVKPVSAKKEETLNNEKWVIDKAMAFLIDRATNFPVFDYATHRYAQYLEGKVVAVVGGSDAVQSLSVRPDIYVRINGHVKRQGGKCNVLYHTCCATPDIDSGLISYLDGLEFAWLNAVDGNYEVRNKKIPTYYEFLQSLRKVKPSVDFGFFAQGEWLEKNPYGPTLEWLNDLHKKYKCKLLTGNVALAHVMMFNPARIVVTNMTMYSEKTGGSREGKIESHEIEGNLQFLKDASNDPRVTFSAEFLEALRDYKF